jgi:hypothetical protein
MRCLIVALAFVCGPVFAAPFLISDASPDIPTPTGCTCTIDGATKTGAIVAKACKVDLATLSVGAHSATCQFTSTPDLGYRFERAVSPFHSVDQVHLQRQPDSAYLRCEMNKGQATYPSASALFTYNRDCSGSVVIEALTGDKATVRIPFEELSRFFFSLKQGKKKQADKDVITTFLEKT